MDDLTLGSLGPTEFFGELSLLPIEGGWSHRRTAMVMQNAMLHTLSKADVQAVSDRFPELRHRLVDHAEDYQRVQAAVAAAAGKLTVDCSHSSSHANIYRNIAGRHREPVNNQGQEGGYWARRCG